MSTDSQQSLKHLTACWALALLGAMPVAIQPFFLRVMSDALTLQSDQIGLLASADILGAVVASFSGIWWLKRFDLPSVVRIAQVTIVLGYVGLIFTDSFETVLALRFLSGLFGHGIAFALGTALLCRTTNPDRSIAISVVTQIVFSAILLLVLPQVLAVTSDQISFILLVAIVAMILPFIRGLTYEADKTPASLKVASYQPIAILLAALIFYQIGLSAIWAFIEPLASERAFSLQETGSMLAVILPVSMLGSIASAVLNLRIGRLLPAFIATLGAAIGLFILEQTHLLTLFAVGFLMHQVAWNFGIAFFYGAVADTAKGSGTEILAPGCQALGSALGPIIAGVFAANYGLGSVIWVSIAGMVIGSTILIYTQTTHFKESFSKE